MKNHNEFSLHWNIYDLDYGVPKIVETWLSDGNIIIINVSRTIIPQARKKFPDLKVIFVKVPFEITLARVKSRGREAEDDTMFKERVARAKINQNFPGADIIIDNSGDLQIAVKNFRKHILPYAQKSELEKN